MTTALHDPPAAVAETTSRRRWPPVRRWAAPTAILALALTVRVALVMATDLPLSDDPADYHRLATNVASGDGFGETLLAAGGGPTAFRSPLYPFVLGVVYDVFGIDVTTARLIQAVFGVVTVALVGLLAHRLFGRRVGLVALALAAVYPPLLLSGSSLITEAVALPLLLGAILLALEYRRRGALPWAVAAGAVSGLGMLARENFVILAIPLVVLVWDGRPRWSRRALGAPLVLLVATAAVVLPWTIRNATAMDALIPISDVDGFILAGVYNDQAADDPRFPATWRPPSGVPSLQPLFDDPTLDEDELSRELRSRAVEYAVDHPSYVARVVFWNTMHLFGFSGRDFAHVTGASLGYSARLSDAGLVGWYAVAALAAVGLVSAPWRRTPLALWSVPVLFAATTVTALGTYRYRAPLEPFALCLAAVAVCAIADRVRRRLLPDVVRDVTPPGPSAFRRFGNGSVIVPPTRVNSPEYIEIGDGVVMLEHGWLSVRAEHGPGRPPRLVVGDRVRFGRAVSIACIGEVVIEDDVMTSDGVFIGDCFHEYADPHTPVIDQPMSIPEPVRIERGAYLGAGSIVLPGVTVGAGAYVGEGAVVTRDVAPRTVVLGNPARVVERYP